MIYLPPSDLFLLGQWVERVGSLKDYTTGRQGVIVDINDSTERVRVMWFYERGGRDMKPIRTWVHYSTIEIVPGTIVNADGEIAPAPGASTPVK